MLYRITELRKCFHFKAEHQLKYQSRPANRLLAYLRAEEDVCTLYVYQENFRFCCNFRRPLAKSVTKCLFFMCPIRLLNSETVRHRTEMGGTLRTIRCYSYGYRGHDCRANLHVLGSGEIVYFIGQVAVLYNHVKHLQRHYREHTTEIKRLVVVHRCNLLDSTMSV